MFFQQIIDQSLSQYAYLIGCQQTKQAIIIDPQRDIDRYHLIAAQNRLQIVAATETHIHADFLSGCREFAEDPNVRVYLSGEGGKDWQYSWVADYPNVEIVKDGDEISVGSVLLQVSHTPGHTPEHISFSVRDTASGQDEPMGMVTGDFVFVGSVGRPDLLETAAGEIGSMEPAAHELHQSLLRFLDLPEYLKVWPGHGAGSACGKSLSAVPDSTVGYEKRANCAIQDALQGSDQFVSTILQDQPDPPTYFARMKRDNRDGPALLRSLPEPKKLSLDELLGKDFRQGSVLIDARPDRIAFMEAHIPGSLYLPLVASFATLAGSYIKPEEDVYAVVPESSLDFLVRQLVRVGIDRVVGFVTPEEVEGYLKAQDGVGRIESETTTNLETLRQDERSLVLDVRRGSEHAARAVPDALNVAHVQLASALDSIPQDKRLLVHCMGGGRAAHASSYLARQGFDVVYINGPFKAWTPTSS